MIKNSLSRDRSPLRRISVLLAFFAGGFVAGYAVKSEIGEQRTALRATTEGTREGVEKMQETPAERPAHRLSLTAEKKAGWPGQASDEFPDLYQNQEPGEPVQKEVIPDSLLAHGAGKEIPHLLAEDLLTTLLQHNPGLFLGDRHGNYNIPEFLTASMSKFARARVKVLFLEMAKSDEDGKKALEQLRQTGDVKAFADYLEKKRWGIEPGWTEKIGMMVKKAYDEGIAVVGMDMEHTGDSRLETSNPHWKSVIVDYLSREEFPKDGKYLVFGGAAHSADYPWNKGVDYLLGIPAVNFVSLKSASPHVRVGDRQDNDFEIVLPESKNQPPNILDGK